MRLKCKDSTKFRRKQRLQKYPHGQVMAILTRSPKTRIFWKSARGGPRQIFQISTKKYPRLKRLIALWRKRHYPPISMPLKCKAWTWFWYKQRLAKCPNSKVMATFGRSLKTPIFWKSAKGYQGYFFKNRPKSSLRLKGPKALCRKWHYSLICMDLNGRDWRRIWGKQAALKVPEWPSYGNLGKVTQNPHFLKKCKGGTMRNFSKIAQKTAHT